MLLYNSSIVTLYKYLTLLYSPIALTYKLQIFMCAHPVSCTEYSVNVSTLSVLCKSSVTATVYVHTIAA